MLKLILLSIGLVLVFEGLLYYFLANRINSLIEQIKKFNPQSIKTFSIIMVALGTCLIYFTFRLYGEY
tara:strand:+ start:208 stop:411 length:204 start_codon:yes stop_codon:yes gene_type:complete